jgi:hypothetical protein
MRYLLVILIVLLPSLTFSGIPAMDTIPRIAIMVNPLQVFSVSELGCTFEYSLNNRIAIEVGGGFSVGNIGASSGYTLRAGVKFKVEKGLYFEPLIFFRQRNYNNRVYKWQSGTHLSERLETSWDPGMGSGSDNSYKEIANENKQVVCIQALFGHEFLLWKYIPVDIYAGVGYRYKHRVKEISSHTEYTRGAIDHEKYYSPPNEEIILSNLFCIQAGVKIGFSFLLKKK